MQKRIEILLNQRCDGVRKSYFVPLGGGVGFLDFDIPNCSHHILNLFLPYFQCVSDTFLKFPIRSPRYS
jgi:hypothetical protein